LGKDDESASSTTRRGALKLLALAGGAAATVVVVVPGGLFLAAPVRGASGQARWVRTVRLDALDDGVPKRISIVADRTDAWTTERSVELGAVWLVRRGAAVDCYSVTCPHLGCAVAYADDAPAHFYCPCHDSSFALDGRCESGPSPRALDKLVTKVDDGHVLVDYRQYRQGTPDQIEVG
jgi:Rieske Fe-S protein